MSCPFLCRPISSSQTPTRHFHVPIHYCHRPLNSLLQSSPRSFLNLSLGLGFRSRRILGLEFITRSSADGGRPSDASVEEEARRQSTLPSRFRHLTKEFPHRPVRWPWLIERSHGNLQTGRKLQFPLVDSCVLLKLLVAIIFHFIGDPITTVIQNIESFLYFIHSLYAGIVAYAPVQELTVIILLTSMVLATAEATVPTSVKSQPYLLTLAGLIGYGAIDGSIPELLFWLLLSSLFCFSRFVEKRDIVSAALPVAAVAAAVGEPWVRILAIVLYLALAVVQHSKSSEGNAEIGTGIEENSSKKLPLPLLFAALSIGIHIFAKWIRYRHLTWKIL